MNHHRPDRRRIRGTFRPSADPLEGRIAPAVLPPGFAESPIASGLERPSAMEFAPDGRLFVAEQDGALRVVRDGQLLPQPFLTLDVDPAGERGLLGVAFDPDFETNSFVYVYYTVPGSPPHNRLSRFVADGDLARPGSEQVLLDLEPLTSATNHNGGALEFAPDGTLFVAVGENARPTLSQRLDTRLGKVLRINPDGSIPADNPFFATADGPNRAIWALGLRNPFTLTVRPETGTLFINDVGANAFEEVNVGVAGANYGWPTTEGPTTDPRFVAPLFAYGHGGDPMAEGCSVIGGAFVPESGAFPAEMAGDYLFADFCNGWIRLLDPDDGTVQGFATGLPPGTVDLDLGPDGELYVLSRGGPEAAVIRIAAIPTTPPPEPPAPPPPPPEPPAPPPPPAPRPIDDATFVAGLYRDVLGREADPGGLFAWLDALATGRSRAEVVRAFEQSEERQVLFIVDAYSRLLGRPPEPVGLAGWLGVLRSGGTREQVLAGIAGSPESFQRQGGTTDGFVRALYRDLLGREAGGPEVAAWQDRLATSSRPDVALAIAGSEEAFLARVSEVYLARLRRPLSTTDRALWSGQYRAGLRTEDAAFFITASPEYTDRLA